MSTKWDLAGAHGVRKYVWHLMETELGWSTANYGGLTPFVTPQQQPELNDYNAPYIVYNYSGGASSDNFWMKQEQMSMSIVSATESDIRKAVNVISAYLERGDESAKDLNEWIAVNGSPENKKFDYKNIAVVALNSADPATSEGGRYDGLIVIRMRYVYLSETIPARPGMERIGS